LPPGFLAELAADDVELEVSLADKYNVWVDVEDELDESASRIG
jgi:hypothetical protein